jgi:hypothetical protein
MRAKRVRALYAAFKAEHGRLPRRSRFDLSGRLVAKSERRQLKQAWKNREAA